MKKTLVNLRVGQVFEARVAEIMSPTDFIVNFDGDLVRVSNQTRQSFVKNSIVQLIVTSIRPLSFKLAVSSNNFSVVI